MSLPAPMKIFIGLIIILLIGGGWYLAGWKADIDQAKILDADIIQKQSDLATVKKQKEELPKEQDKNRQLQAELRSVIQEQLTPESESEFVPSYIADIEKLVEQQRARMGDPDFIVVSLTPENVSGGGKSSAPTALSGYPTRGFQMSLTGRYATVIDFLRQLGDLKLKRLVTISKITLSPVGSSENYFESPVLNVTLPITVYLREGGNK